MAVIKQWTGTEWVVMTTGYTGSQGTQGDLGYTGSQGLQGASAYAQAEAGGYTDTEANFLLDLAAIDGLAAELEAI